MHFAKLDGDWGLSPAISSNQKKFLSFKINFGNPFQKWGQVSLCPF